MTPERRANLRKRIEEAYAKGARPETNGIYMPVSMGELIELIDAADHFDSLLLRLERERSISSNG